MIKSIRYNRDREKIITSMKNELTAFYNSNIELIENPRCVADRKYRMFVSDRVLDDFVDNKKYYMEKLDIFGYRLEARGTYGRRHYHIKPRIDFNFLWKR